MRVNINMLALFLTKIIYIKIYTSKGDDMVYIDLLVVEDLALNYIVLLATSILLNRVTKLKKIFLSSGIGTIPLIG